MAQQNDESNDSNDVTRLSDPAWRLRAEQELGETDQVRHDSLHTLKGLIKGDSRLQSPLNDEFLIMFLRVTKFNPDAAFWRLKRLAQLATTVSHWESHVDVSKMEEMFQKSSSTVAEQLDPLGRKLIVSLVGRNWDPSAHPAEALVVASAVLMLSLVADDPRVQVGGFALVLDHKGYGLRHAAHATPSLIKLVSTIVRECCPLRLKEIHLTNMPKIVKVLYTVVSPLLGSKIRKRIVLHGSDLSVIREKFPLELLPVEFGGTCPSLAQSSYCYDLVKRAEQRGALNPFRELRYLQGDE